MGYLLCYNCILEELFQGIFVFITHLLSKIWMHCERISNIFFIAKYILYSKRYSSKYILFGNQCFNKDLNSPFLCMKVRRMLSNIIWFSFTNECSNSCEKFRRNFSRLELKTNGRSSKICYVGYLVCIELQATYLNHVLHDMVFKFLY